MRTAAKCEACSLKRFTRRREPDADGGDTTPDAEIKTPTAIEDDDDMLDVRGRSRTRMGTDISRTVSVSPNNTIRSIRGGEGRTRSGSRGSFNEPQILMRGTLDIVPITDPLGLTLVHTASEPIMDIIFVHGLGGTSKRTWSYQRDPANFWPAWLSSEVELSNARVFTFGYNADFSIQHHQMSILDFSKDLLFRMKTFSSVQDPQEYPIGKYPIVFVMHSMGGLVVKKAYIIGRSDDQYSEITSNIRAMLFLATPHKGSAFAEMLNNILRSTPKFSAKSYVSELEKSSNLLQDINEQFRTACNNIELVSLYETQKTSMGMGTKKLMVVDKQSAVLGYPTETSSALNADHHSITKFVNTEDTNYVHVRNVLKMFLRGFISSSKRYFKNLYATANSLGSIEAPVDSVKGRIMTLAANKKLQEFLGVSDEVNDDFEFLRDRILPGSCQWILKRQSFIDWVNLENKNLRTLWLTALPATGKSILSSFIVDCIQKNSSIGSCQYYFFKSEHQSQRTVGHMLLTLAYQIAITNEPFRQKLLELYDTGGISLERHKVNILWETIFEGLLFKGHLHEPVFWIIDGLNEADRPEVLIRLLARIPSTFQFKILIVSRAIRDLAGCFDKETEMIQDEITADDTLEDIRSYTKSVLSANLRSSQILDEISSKVLEKAHGSFLWVTLALTRLKDSCHTQKDIDQALNELPEDMEPLYQGMIHLISEQAQRPRTIAARILAWAVCSFRPLEIGELEVALSSEFGEFVSLKDTISQICGHFVVVEKSRIRLIHDTARYFLLHQTGNLPMSIDNRKGHEYIASTCIKYLIDPKKNWRRTFSLVQEQSSNLSLRDRRQGSLFKNNPFLEYAVTRWAYHVSLATSRSELIQLVFNMLENFCLVWINAVALLGDMRILTRAGQYLRIYVKRRIRRSSNESLPSLSGNRHDEIRQWAKDLIRIVGRFGHNLTQSPISIYKNVIPFCPKGSILSRTYGHKNPLSNLSVEGISSDTWDDCLARLTMGDGEFPTAILCKGSFFITLVGRGTLVVWHAESYQEVRRIEHGEWVSNMEVSCTSNIIATAGITTIKIWDIQTGDELFSLAKTYDRRILALSLGTTDDELFVGYDNSTIQCYDLKTLVPKWELVTEDPNDSSRSCPSLMVFSPDACQVIIGYRGRPVLAWNLDSPTHIPQICIRPADRNDTPDGTQKAVTPEWVLWRANLPEVIILYNDSSLVQWNIEDDTQREIVHISAREMAISSDGNLLLTSDHNGVISIWTVPEFNLTYQLQYPNMVRDLTFSPDGQRFYDIRDYFCNIWEPDALVRPDDLDREDLSSTQETNVSELVSSLDAPRAQITALVCDTDDAFFCCGKESGAVVLHEMEKGQKIRKLYSHSSVVSIIVLAWSLTGKVIASADDCGRVIVKRLRKPGAHGPTWGVFPFLDFRRGDAITQLLFSECEQFLLVASKSCAWVWNLKSKCEIVVLKDDSDTSRKWINHPNDPNLLLSIDVTEIRIFKWDSLPDDFTGREYITLSLTCMPHVDASSNSHLELSHKVDTVLSLTKASSTKIVVEIGSIASPTSYSHFTLLDFAPLVKSSALISQWPLPAPLSNQITHLIGSFNNKLLFLNQRYRFCTYSLLPPAVGIPAIPTPTTPGFQTPLSGFEAFGKNAVGRNGCEGANWNADGMGEVKGLFSLPKDWLNADMLGLCCVSKVGTVLCPKNGEVAVIRAATPLSVQNGTPTHPTLTPNPNSGPTTNGPTVLAAQPSEAAMPLILARYIGGDVFEDGADLRAAEAEPPTGGGRREVDGD
ncbi:hypothetical protein B7494_g7860 [Chlorociboria aeruginascens]|nr:hypothetical protein B7494_g7860 [Chlorociboria aeruginascens]